MSGRSVLGASTLLCVACAAPLRPAPSDVTVNVPEAQRGARVPALTDRAPTRFNARRLWQSLTTGLTNPNAGLGELLHPTLGVLAAWPYGGTMVTARFDELGDLLDAGTVYTLDSLDALDLPHKLEEDAISVDCGAAGTDDARAVVEHAHSRFASYYAAMRAAELIPDQEARDEKLARRADGASSYRIYVPRHQLVFYFGEVDGTWRWLGVEAYPPCLD